MYFAIEELSYLSLFHLSRFKNTERLLYNIRIYHECAGRIEKSVPRIAV